MPRPLVYSNGSMLLAADSRGVIRDLFYPQVGRWNHLSGYAVRMGVALQEGDSWRFSWLDSDEWDIALSYRAESLLGQTRFASEEFSLVIECEEGISHSHPWFVRCFHLLSQGSAPVRVRVFFTQDLRIMESDIGDTAFLHPGLRGIVHYKGPCHFLFAAESPLGGPTEVACGLKGFGGFEGTWRDAEDGMLSGNPIAQGSVDSTFAIDFELQPGESQEGSYVIVAADALDELEHLTEELRLKSAQERLNETAHHWQGWCSPLKKSLAPLASTSPAVLKLCEQSLLLMRAHIDNNGAIIASIDSAIMETNRANYAYMWPRDGALISYVLDKTGHHHLPRAFFELCGRILPTHPPMLRQKYTADGKMGAAWHPWTRNGKLEVPFQEDETALTVLGVWHHHQAHPDTEALASHWLALVEPSCDFMAAYRDDRTGLPGPSYDLWEERYGIHTFTVCSVVAGLRAASEIAHHLGKKQKGKAYAEAAAAFNSALLKHLVNPSTGCFWRRLDSDEADATIDASLLHVSLLDILPVDHPNVMATVKAVEESLWIPELRGVARYEGDYYFRRHDDLPGNPWIICTLWLAQHRIRAGALESALELIEWCAERATTTGVLPEQVDAVTGEHLSVSPLTWSHAEFLRTCFEYCEALAARS